MGVRMASSAKLGDVVKNVPNALIWAITIAFVAILAAFVILAATGSSSADLRSILNTILNVASVIFGGTGLAAAAAAAKSAGRAEQQTNGQVDQRITDGVR